MSLIKFIDFPDLGDNRGSLIPVESVKQVPFEIKRVYFLTNLSADLPRGFHAHKELDQVAMCVSGNCRVLLDDGVKKEWVNLSSPTKALRIEPMIWHEMHGFSSDCVFMVFANEHYDEADYIRNYEDFLSKVEK